MRPTAGRFPSPATARSPGARPRARTGFTLAEVMIALVLVALMCLAALGGLHTMSKLSLRTAIRSEAHRLLQDEAERLSAVDFSGFAASANQTFTSNFQTTFLPGVQASLSYPTSGNSGRVTFTRRVVQTASTATSRTLRVEVQWTWQGRSSTITLPMFRTQ